MAKSKTKAQRQRAAIAAEYGLRPLSAGAKSAITEVIPTGLGVLDHHLLGVGGIPCGRIGEVYGTPASGKTSLAFACIAGAQALGYEAVLVETESALDPTRAEAFGVNLDDVLYGEPESIEDTLNTIIGVMRGWSQGPDVPPRMLVWDSIASAPIDKENTGQVQDYNVGTRGRLMSAAFRQIPMLAKRTRTAVVLINQTRTKMGVVFGDPTVTPGGDAHKFAATWRLQMWGGKEWQSSGEPAGRAITLKTMKSRLKRPGIKAQVRFSYAGGWDDAWSTVELAKTLKLIPARARASAKTLTEARVALGWEEAS